MNEKQGQTYRLAGVQAEDGTLGALVFDVKPGGNVHAEFEPLAEQPPRPAEPAPPGGTPEQLPAEQLDEPG